MPSSQGNVPDPASDLTLPIAAAPADEVGANANAPEPSPAPFVSAPPRVSPVERMLANRARIESEFREVRQIVIFYGAVLLPLLFLAGWCHHRKDADTLRSEFVLGTIMYAVIAVFAWRWRDHLKARFTWPRHIGARLWLLTAATPLLTLTCVTFALSASERMGWPVEPVITPQHIDRWPMFAWYLWIAVCPAVFEEIAFRGLLLAKLRQLMTPTQAIWVTTLLFGIIHFDIIAMAIFLIPIAWIAGWLTLRTRSLLPAMMIHFAHNAGVLTLELLG